MPDGNGTKASVAGPAKRAEVAVLHAVKALGSAQTNFAGGQGYYNFLTFLAPYFEGLEYDEIKQLIQMFVYEMTQMMVARGGQLVFSSVQLTRASRSSGGTSPASSGAGSTMENRPRGGPTGSSSGR
jgi:ribonucleoside-triphosphate reductase